MLKHQKIRESQAEVRALYAAGVISTPEFVSSMNQLKVDLEAEEEKLYARYSEEDVSDDEGYMSDGIRDCLISSNARTLNDEVGKFNTNLTAAFSTGKTNKAAVKRARAAIGEVKKLAAELRKDLQAKVNAEVA